MCKTEWQILLMWNSKLGYRLCKAKLSRNLHTGNHAKRFNDSHVIKFTLVMNVCHFYFSTITFLSFAHYHFNSRCITNCSYIICKQLLKSILLPVFTSHFSISLKSTSVKLQFVTNLTTKVF